MLEPLVQGKLRLPAPLKASKFSPSRHSIYVLDACIIVGLSCTQSSVLSSCTRCVTCTAGSASLWCHTGMRAPATSLFAGERLQTQHRTRLCADLVHAHALSSVLHCETNRMRQSPLSAVRRSNCLLFLSNEVAHEQPLFWLSPSRRAERPSTSVEQRRLGFRFGRHSLGVGVPGSPPCPD
jgi:hypothetical protein